jgi:hypothetical protein
LRALPFSFLKKGVAVTDEDSRVEYINQTLAAEHRDAA